MNDCRRLTIMTTQLFNKTVLSTESLPDRQSVGAWKEHLAEVYCRQDVRLLSGDRISGRLSRRIVGNLSVSEFKSGGAQRVVRTNEQAKSDSVEHFHFAFPSAGTFAYQQSRNDACVSGGGSFILNASNKFIIDFSHDAEGLVVAVPCQIIRDRIIAFDDFVARGRISDPLFISLISHMAVDLLHIHSSVDRGRIQEVCLSLLDIAVAETRRGEADQGVPYLVSDLLLAGLRKEISENYFNSQLSLDDVATSCRVSKRKLQQALAQCRTTFSRELLNVRLDKASHLLKTRPRSTTRIAQIAILCGFVSQSHFSTAYSRRFGVSPKEHQLTV